MRRRVRLCLAEAVCQWLMGNGRRPVSHLAHLMREAEAGADGAAKVALVDGTNHCLFHLPDDHGQDDVAVRAGTRLPRLETHASAVDHLNLDVHGRRTQVHWDAAAIGEGDGGFRSRFTEDGRRARYAAPGIEPAGNGTGRVEPGRACTTSEQRPDEAEAPGALSAEQGVKHLICRKVD